jgi:hypothetical protein
MQPTIGTKRFVVNHMAAMALLCAVLISGVLGIAGLGVTGNLPWTADGDRSNVAAPATRADEVAQAGARKEARLEASEQQATEYAAGVALAEQMRQAAAHKEASLDAQEQQRTDLAASTARQEAIRRYYAHKEQQLDAMGQDEASHGVPHDDNHLILPFQPEP